MALPMPWRRRRRPARKRAWKRAWQALSWMQGRRVECPEPAGQPGARAGAGFGHAAAGTGADAHRQGAAGLIGAARLATLTRGEPLEAEALARRAAAAFEASHERAGQAQALSLLAVAILHARGDRAAALQCCQRALALATQARHVPAQRSALLNLIKIHTDQGVAEAALALIDQGQALALGFEHPTAEQAFAQARYFVHYLRGDVLRAEAAAHQLLQLARKLRDRNAAGFAGGSGRPAAEHRSERPEYWSARPSTKGQLRGATFRCQAGLVAVASR
jgi:tetratricopeptide (TPR) repeat protein